MSLDAQHVSVMLRGREVVREVSFTAERGSFLVIVGPNGAGKTTLLKAIAGLLPYAGTLKWDGQNLATMTAARRAKILAYLPQGHIAHWPISAREVVAIGRAPFASSLARLGPADHEAIDTALALVEAAGLASRPITELSGGERARVMLARALAVGAPLLLADEPVAALDPAHQLAVMGILKERARAGGLVIAISHDLVLAARFADRILVLDDGRRAAFAPPGEALSPDILRSVFQVETLAMQAGEARVNLPWTIAR